MLKILLLSVALNGNIDATDVAKLIYGHKICGQMIFMKAARALKEYARERNLSIEDATTIVAGQYNLILWSIGGDARKAGIACYAAQELAKRIP